MQANTFDVVERRVRITIFKLGKLWVFKQFFDNKEVFNALLDYYNKDLYRFEFKSTGARNNALKICDGPEELRGLQGDCEREDIPERDWPLCVLASHWLGQFLPVISSKLQAAGYYV
jgi:hypothetical protein